jgi:hypothetical protein
MNEFKETKENGYAEEILFDGKHTIGYGPGKEEPAVKVKGRTRIISRPSPFPFVGKILQSAEGDHFK